MTLSIPDMSLVVLIGPSGSGKSTFARKHFLSTEVLSSDFCRALVTDNENDQAATKDAFETLHFIAGKRLKVGRLVVVDATNVQPEARKPLVQIAREHYCLPVAIVLDLPEKACVEHNRGRTDRSFGPDVIRRQRAQMDRGLRSLKREGFRYIHRLRSQEEIDEAVIERTRLWVNRSDEHGPFDVIGDVHGCLAELRKLLGQLGYDLEVLRHPQGRKAVFLGDVVDRGPDVAGVLRLVMDLVSAGAALCVCGNHENKLLRALRGQDVRISHGLEQSLGQLSAESPEFREEVVGFLDGLLSHLVLDGGRVVVAHAGLREEMHGRASGRVRDFALYGETTGETDEFGLPVRYNWAAEYRGRAAIVYGHTRGSAGMAEQHDQHRLRLRLRWQANGSAIPREGARFCGRGRRLLRGRSADFGSGNHP